MTPKPETLMPDMVSILKQILILSFLIKGKTSSSSS